MSEANAAFRHIATSKLTLVMPYDLETLELVRI